MVSQEGDHSLALDLLPLPQEFRLLKEAISAREFKGDFLSLLGLR